MSIRMISQLRRWNADVAWLGQPSTTSIRLLPLQSYLRFFSSLINHPGAIIILVEH